MDYFDAIAALTVRFADKPPKHGVVFKTPCKLVDRVLYIDSYGRGCTTDSAFNPYKKDLQSKRQWNAPMPFPSDLAKVLKALNDGGYDKIVLGRTSEFVPWMDHKYGIAKSILRLVARLAPSIPVALLTSSDLIAHEDYMSELTKQVVVEMRANLSPRLEVALKKVQDEYMRRMEPGGPSLLRRSIALDRLEAKGIRCKRVSVKKYHKVA